jgi:glutamyl-tRNA reductase
MRLHCLGINHQTAEVSTREKLAFDINQTKSFWEALRKETERKVDELVVLSTCNRVEIYAVSEQPFFAELEKTLVELRDISGKDIGHLFYRLVDEQVISHLLRVSSGLDSMVLGEPQILGQVTEAYQTGLEIGSCGKMLSKLFQSAISTGKRVRTETDISKNSMSVSSLAAQVTEQIVGNVSDSQITLLGAGEMAELAIEALKKRGANKFIVISRTINSACTLAQKWDGHAGTMENLAGALENTDILLTSTSAPHTIIHRSLIEGIMANRPNRPLVIIDIAVPRDVASDVKDIAGVSLFDIDRLNQGVVKAVESRESEIPKVEKIIDEEYLTFKEYFGSLKVLPVIAGIRQQANAIRQQELEKALRQLDGIDPKQQERIKALTHAIVQKILHEPTIRLRQEANGPNGEKYAVAVSELFGLNGKNGDHSINE